MKSLKVMTVYGTRPEAIKVAPVIKAFEASSHIESLVTVTGQHRQMLDQVNAVFGIFPDVDLEIMSQGQGLNSILSKVVSGIDDVYKKYCPDVVVVQGDTSTAMGAAIAAFNQQIPVVHIEAGLRSGNIMSPFPEEANRKIISQIASLHLAPTEQTQQNLLNEGISSADIVVTGNTVIDALLESLDSNLPIKDERVEQLLTNTCQIVLVTTHRRENLGEGIDNIGQAIEQLATEYPHISFVMPLHLNPEIRKRISPYLKAKNIVVTEPIAYGDFTRLLSQTYLVLTDSGGIQEEAPGINIPVLVMRDTTERQEGLNAGTLKLVGTQSKRIIECTRELLDNPTTYEEMAVCTNPYGDGKASQRILDAMLTKFM